jgi:hypothetical protein
MAIPHIIVYIGVWCVTNHVGVISNDKLHHMDMTILPSSYEKTTILANNHVACAQYFDWIMNIIIEVLMGWEIKLQYPTPSGGLFGFCKGFFASTKSQGFGNLHAH